MDNQEDNQLHLVALPPNVIPPHIEPFNQPLFLPPEWIYNQSLMVEHTRMVYPQMDIIIDFRLFIANVLEVAPRYRRVSMIVSPLGKQRNTINSGLENGIDE